MDEKRSCYNCQYQSLCFLRRRIDDALQGVWMLNMDRDNKKSPRIFTDIYDTLAEICTEYTGKCDI